MIINSAWDIHILFKLSNNTYLTGTLPILLLD